MSRPLLDPPWGAGYPWVVGRHVPSSEFPVRILPVLALVLVACGSDDPAPVAATDAPFSRDVIVEPDVPTRDFGGPELPDQDGGQDADVGLDADAAPDSEADTGEDVERDSDIELDAVTDADADIAPDAPMDTAPDAPTDIERDTPIDAEPDAPADAEPDMAADAEPDAPADTEPDVEPDATPDTEPDAPADVEPDTPADAEPDTPADVEPDLPVDTEPDADVPVEPFCGDGVVDPDEECDDGNDLADDGCFECVTEGADEIFLQLRNVPELADRVFISLDGGGLPAPSVIAQEIDDEPVVHVRYAVAGGGTFRVRALATIGAGFPSVLAGGRLDAVAVPESGAVGGVIDLEEVTVTRIPPTPDTATVAEPYEIAVRVHDPANAFDGRGSGRLWVSDEPFSELSATQEGGSMAREGGDYWTFSTELVAGNPNTPRTTYYQFGESANGFEFGGEVPFLVRPSVRAGEALFEIDVLPSQSGMNLAVTDLRPETTRVYLSIDGGVLEGEPLRIDEAPGLDGVALFNVAVPAGDDYRVRAIGTVGDGSFPIVLSGGLEEAIDIPSFPFIDVELATVPPTVELVAPTPDEITIGHPFTLTMEITDPAEFLEGRGSGRIYSSTEPPIGDLRGGSMSASLTRTGPGRITATADISPITEGEMFYFQFAESSSGDFGRDGTIAPFLALPSLLAGEEFLSLPLIEPAEGIEATISGIPDDATLLVIVVDGGLDPGRYEVPVAGTEVVERLPVPIGTDYRVRVIALRAATGFPPVIGGGWVDGIDVVEGVYASAAIPLEIPAITLSPETPSTAGPSSAVTISAELYDPADFLDGRSSARLWSRMSPFSNLSADQDSGSMTYLGDGFWDYSITITTPAERGTFYYQIGESAGGPWGTSAWAPFWVAPDTEAGEDLFELVVE